MAYKRLMRAARKHGPTLARKGAGAIAAAVAQQMNATRTITQTINPVSTSTALMTAQSDTKTDYTKRRRSKRQRRRGRARWRRKRALINTVRNANVGSTHIVRRSLCLLSSTPGVSNSVGFGLYGLNGTAGDTFNTCDDVGEIFDEMDATSWANVTNPLADVQNHKIYAFHGTAEYTIRNTHASNDCIIEAYFIRGTRPLNATLAANPVNAYFDGFRKQATATDPNTGATFEGPLAATQIGVTPFQCQLFCRHFRIYRRQKFRIEPGAEVSFVISDPRRRVFNMQQARVNSTDRNYHGVVFQQQGPPDASGGVEDPALPTAVTYLVTRRYRIKMFRDNLVKDSFETAA